jgi:hypothetical protein
MLTANVARLRTSLRGTLDQTFASRSLDTIDMALGRFEAVAEDADTAAMHFDASNTIGTAIIDHVEAGYIHVLPTSKPLPTDSDFGSISKQGARMLRKHLQPFYDLDSRLQGVEDAIRGAVSDTGDLESRWAELTDTMSQYLYANRKNAERT